MSLPYPEPRPSTRAKFEVYPDASSTNKSTSFASSVISSPSPARKRCVFVSVHQSKGKNLTSQTYTNDGVASFKADAALSIPSDTV